MGDTKGQSEIAGSDAAKPVQPESEKIKGLRIEKLDYADIGKIRAWRNDYRIWQWCRQHDYISDVEHEQWFRNQSANPTIRMYKIVAVSDKNKFMVGVCGLTSIDMLNRRAEFSLYIAPEFQGQHYGQGGLQCLLTHGFTNLGLNCIWGETFEGNHAARIFQKMGFTKEGTRRDFYFRDGKFIDAHLYSMRASEWIKR